MANIFTELTQYFLDKVPITSRCGSGKDFRMYMDYVRQGVQMPFIRLVVDPVFSAEHLGGIAGQRQNVISIYAYAKTIDEADELAEAIRLAPLQQYRGLMGSTYVKVSDPDGPEWGYDPPERASDRPRMFVERDYIFTYSEDTS